MRCLKCNSTSLECIVDGPEIRQVKCSDCGWEGVLPVEINYEAIARHYCDSNNLEYEGHEVREDGELKVLGVSRKPFEFIQVDCEIGIK